MAGDLLLMAQHKTERHNIRASFMVSAGCKIAKSSCMVADPSAFNT
jgi:hypothetical protein